MMKIQKKAMLALLTLTLLLTTIVGGCGNAKVNADLQKVTLNDDAPFFSFFKMEVTAILLPFFP